MSTEEQQPLTMEAKIDFLQQQLSLLLQQQPQQQQQPVVPNAAVHSLLTRPKYDWTPSPTHVELMRLNQDLFTSSPLLDGERKKLIESYPPIDGLDYQPPDAVPQAYRLMNDQQRSQDGSLKSTQYLISAIFRPLDVLTHELINNEGLEASEKYLKMINDIRSLLLHANSTVTQYRTGLAYKTVNNEFKLPNPEQRYTVSMDEFQSTVNQLHAASKSLKEAKNFGRKKRAPFRSGPPSQHGGSSFDKTFSSNHQRSGTHSGNSHSRSSQGAASSSNYNPFRKSAPTSNRK